MSYELFELGPAVYIPVFLVSLLITLVAYGAFPLIFARVRKKAITKKKYYIICYVVNILVTILLSFIYGKLTTYTPYLLWTWVFSASGIKILKRRGILSESQAAIRAQAAVFETIANEKTADGEELAEIKEEALSVEKEPLIKFCSSCGHELLPKSNFCSTCGVPIAKE